MKEKTCFKCGETKPFSEFYAHPQMSDGYTNKCKTCTKKDVYENREKRQEYYKAYDRNRPNKEERKKKNIERRKTEAGRQAHNEAARRWVKKSSHRRKAQYMLSNAIRDGKIEKLPCFVCGKLEVEGHHPNYDAPLDVIWLCVKHHSEIHRLYNEEEDLRILAETRKGNRWDDDSTSI